MVQRRRVVLVDVDGQPIGEADKRQAHVAPGRLHLAFSVFLFDETGKVLVQQRSPEKYHFAGVWANAVCSHPEPGEELDLVESARRRLSEELGIGPELPIELVEAGSFVYRAVDPVSGLVEHEYDHVLVGCVPTPLVLRPAADEVAGWRLAPVGEVRGAGSGDGFAPWFAEALEIALTCPLPDGAG